MCRQTILTTTFSYYDGRYNMFQILGPKRPYYFDNIVTPSASIPCPPAETLKSQLKIFL